jgi:hypothetical protein
MCEETGREQEVYVFYNEGLANHIGGRVADLHFTVSYWWPELIAIDQQPDDEVMPLGRAGKADRLAGEPRDPGPQRQIFALDLLRVPLARLVLVGIEMPCICASIVGVIARDTKRLEQRFALQKHLILPPLMTWSL